MRQMTTETLKVSYCPVAGGGQTAIDVVQNRGQHPDSSASSRWGLRLLVFTQISSVALT
jgi:hypothetical protein